MASIAQGCNAALPNQGAVEMAKVLNSLRADLVALTAAYNQLRTDYNANATIATDTTAPAVVLTTSA